jgi:hypothetical protein
MSTKITPKNIDKYVCGSCDFKSCKIGDWKRHLSTVKHKTLTLSTQINDFTPDYTEPITYTCINCNKSYKERSGLWRHKKICNQMEEKEEKPVKTEKEKDSSLFNFVTPELVMEILKDNKDMKDIIIEQNKTINELIKNGINNTTNNTNCNNKTFNLQVFLNETCKDAMNIMDFVDSIKLQLADLESVGELGYVKGLSNIIVKNLRALDITQRPVHCSDAKREILYVKDNDVWEKEDPENSKMKKAVKYIAYKNTKLLPLWKQTYPECMQYDSSKSDKYNYMVIEAMGGAGDNEGEKINKIIKQIAKQVVIEK